MNVSSANTNSCFLPLAHGIPLITINAIVCVLGSLGNVLVCLAIATNPPLRRASNYLLFSLAIADLIVTLVCEPLILEFISNLTFFHGCITSLKQLVYSALVSLSCQASIIHLATISLDRFVAVGFPLRHKIFMDKGGFKVMLIVSWSIPILVSVLSFIIPPASSLVLSFGFFIFAFSGLSIFFFNFLIVVVLLHRKKTTRQLRARKVSLKLTARIEVHVTCTLAIATGVFIICWVPPMMILAVFAAKTLKQNGPLHMWLQTLALSNSAMNFLIYSAKIGDFRDAFVGIVRKILRL